MASSDKRSHHFVPASLNTHFCLKGKTLYQYDISTGKIAKSSPRDIFVRKDLHSVLTAETTMDHNQVEALLNDIEGPGVTAVRKLLRNQFLQPSDRMDIAAFWALQYTRTPFMRRQIESFLKEVIKNTGKMIENMSHSPKGMDLLQEKFDYDFSSFRDFPFGEMIDRGDLQIDILPQVTMMAMQATPKIMDLIFRMNWCLLKSEKDNFFLLSDNPCSMFDQFYNLHKQSFGLGAKGLELALPIGKNHCLVAGWKKMPLRTTATIGRVKEINKRTAIFGERFFAYPTESPQIMGFLKKYANSTPVAKLDTLPPPGLSKNHGYMTLIRQNFFESGHLYENCQPIF